MVLYVKALKQNCEDHLAVVHRLRAACDRAGIPLDGYEESVAVTRANIQMCDELLLSGVTKLVLPKGKE